MEGLLSLYFLCLFHIYQNCNSPIFLLTLETVPRGFVYLTDHGKAHDPAGWLISGEITWVVFEILVDVTLFWK